MILFPHIWGAGTGKLTTAFLLSFEMLKVTLKYLFVFP